MMPTLVVPGRNRSLAGHKEQAQCACFTVTRAVGQLLPVGGGRRASRSSLHNPRLPVSKSGAATSPALCRQGGLFKGKLLGHTRLAASETSSADEGPTQTTTSDVRRKKGVTDSPEPAESPAGPHDQLTTNGNLDGLPTSNGTGSHGFRDVRSQAKGFKIPHRWRVVVMLAVAFVLCNMDKVNMSVAVISMANQFSWSSTDRGLVSSAFFWGYTLTQLPAGWLATKFGGPIVLMAGVALWSFGTLIAPPAATLGLGVLCASRVLVGLGEGFAPAAATSVIARLVPYTERSTAVSVVWGGLDVGSAVGLILCGPLIRVYGWPIVFYLFGVFGGIWCLLWPLCKPDREAASIVKEQEDKRQMEAAASSHEPAQNTSAKDSGGNGTRIPWRAFLTSKPVWAVIVAHFCFNWGYYTLLAWLPSYFEIALGLNVERSSYLTLIPYIAMTAMMPLVGPLADGMVKKGITLTNVRKISQGLAFVGPAICMIGCGLLSPNSASEAVGTTITAILVILLSVGFALGAWSRAGLYCNHQDLSPKYAGVLLGLTNTFGAAPGILGVASAGYLFDYTGSWALALFLPTAVFQLLGAVVYSLFASSERQTWS